MSALKVLTYPNKLLKLILWNRMIQYTNRIARPMSTIDHKQIEHHSSFKNDWWDLNGKMSGLHIFAPLRVQFIRKGLANTGLKTKSLTLPLEGVKIADIGCGGGILTERLARIGAQVTGIDPSVELIDIAKQHVQLDSDISDRVNYIQTTIEEFSEKNEELYDVVVASEVLEHLVNPELFLKESVKILKPGGSIFITTINKTPASWFGGIIVAEYIINIVPRGTHTWDKFIAPHEVQRILEKYGCKTKLIHGAMINLLTNRWSWTSCTAINYALHAIKQKKTDTQQ
ncbi:ubiquinone biosynthesis O-methyltransferase, mitochondrial [Linepithema humile]|uniref:ubiquinone biosynthesis O-methyltransferase, mitochondrial n=1 Tax=Linepithema humile TaxID=83485 RepID=UPI0006238FB0|nr:PREDICTED: hexaprenyldihydroxybenzoate methyltransferase, mitochondrial-like [Linepithema humile]